MDVRGFAKWLGVGVVVVVIAQATRGPTQPQRRVEPGFATPGLVLPETTTTTTLPPAPTTTTTVPVQVEPTVEAVWGQLAECLSGGDWTKRWENGYSGGLRLLPAIWRRYGGSTEEAYEAPIGEQIRVATLIRDDTADYRYWANTGCPSRLGLG